MSADRQDSTGHLLLIDDEQEILKSMRRQFRERYTVRTADSAEEGWRIMCEEPVQVIISDRRMPGMTGTESCNKINAEYPDAVCLILTTGADTDEMIAAINNGNVFRCIRKPWNPEEMDAVVCEAFRYCRLIRDRRKRMRDLKKSNAALRNGIAEKEKARKELRQHRDRLRQTLTERTEALERSNELLRKEISAHRETAAELRVAKESAETANRAKSEFLAHMSHELRTPLNGILGYAQILKKDRTISRNQRSGLDIIERSGNHLLNLIRNIMDLSKTEARKMELPEHAPPETVPKDDRQIISFQGSRRKILVADDKSENREMLRDLLSPLGFDVRAAENGRDAIEKALEFVPDLIFMDLIMPVMDGCEAAMQIRGLAELPHVRIIALSANTMADVRRKCLRAGCDDYIAKPVDTDHVLQKIREQLKTEWVYEDAFLETQKQETVSEDMIRPSAETLLELKKMADVGDISALRAEADKLADGNECFRSFAEELRRLTRTFEIERIQRLIKVKGCTD